MRIPLKFILIIVLLGGILPFMFLSACTDDDDDDAATPTPTSSPTATPTSTPVPNTPPETTITSGPDIATEFPILFTFAGSDAEDPAELLEFSWKVDNYEWSDWQSASTASISGLNNGVHLFMVKARDSEYLEDSSPAEWSFTVAISSDDEAPETWIIDGPAGEINTVDVQYLFTGSDNETPTSELQFSYILDNDEWSEYGFETEVNYTDLAEGLHYFSVRAMDGAGNVDPTPDTRTFTIVVSEYDLSMTPSQQTKYVGPGEEAEFRVDFQNTGLYQTTFTFHHDISSLPADWIAIYCLSNGQCAVGDIDMTLAVGESDYMVIHITPSAASTSGQSGHTILSATCNADPSFYVSSTATAIVN